MNINEFCLDNTVKPGYSEHAYYEMTQTAKRFLFPETLLHVSPCLIQSVLSVPYESTCHTLCKQAFISMKEKLIFVMFRRTCKHNKTSIAKTMLQTTL